MLLLHVQEDLSNFLSIITGVYIMQNAMERGGRELMGKGHLGNEGALKNKTRLKKKKRIFHKN